MPFLKNCWYLAAWGEEIPAGGMMARQIAGEHVLFIRDDDGNVAAVSETCPHRFAPLGMGSCSHGVVTCPYHGIRFDMAGKCVENPHGPISSALKLKSFSTAERHSAIWLWLGDENPDENMIPNYDFIDRTAPDARVKGYLHSRADYRLMVDNIMDLTHADYLHATSLGGGINTRAKAQAERDNDKIKITWTAMNDQLAPLHAQILGSDLGDFYNQVIWEAPGNMVQRILLSRPGQLETAGMDSLTCHVMTPETEASTHYFFCHTSDAVSAHPEIAPGVRAGLVAAFADEDAPMLAAQTRRIAGADFWSLKPALLPSDKGAVLARRELDALLAKEGAMA